MDDSNGQFVFYLYSQNQFLWVKDQFFIDMKESILYRFWTKFLQIQPECCSQQCRPKRPAQTSGPNVCPFSSSQSPLDQELSPGYRRYKRLPCIGFESYLPNILSSAPEFIFQYIRCLCMPLFGLISYGVGGGENSKDLSVLQQFCKSAMFLNHLDI